MTFSGGPPAPGSESMGADFGVMTKAMQELRAELQVSRQEVQELRQMVEQQPAPVAPVAPVPPVAPVLPVAQPTQPDPLMLLLFKNMMETNQLVLTKALERPEPTAPVSPLSDPVIQELLRSKEDMFKVLLETKVPGAFPSEDTPQGKLKGVVDRLVEKQLERLIDGDSPPEEKDGLLDKFLEVAERTGSIDKIMDAAAERLKGSEKKPEPKRTQEQEPLNPPNVEPPATQRSIPPQTERPPLRPSGSDVAISQVENLEDLIVAAASAIRDNIPPADFVKELPQEARTMLRLVPEQQLLTALRSADIPLLKSTRARQWVQSALRLL